MKILISGATGGIGSEITKYLLKNNKIVAIARDLGRLKKLKDEIDSENLDIMTVDVSSKESVEQCFSQIKTLDVLINCAAILGPVCLFGQSDLEKWRETLDIGLMGTVYMTYFALPLLQKSRKGKIINFSGGGSASPRIYHSAYGTAKTGVVRFSETVAAEYPNLDINVIAPGAYKTNMWKDETHDKEPENWGDMDGLKRFVEFMCSKKSDGLTGRFIHYKDDWQNINNNVLKKDMFTLRRIEK